MNVHPGGVRQRERLLRVLEKGAPTGLGLLTLGAILLVWEFMPRLGNVSPSLLVPFSEVAQRVWSILSTGQIPSPYLQRGDVASFFLHFSITGQAVLWAFFWALAVGTGFGLVLWKFMIFDRMLRPYLLIYYALPWIALYPLFILFLGGGRLSVIALGFLYALGAITINTYLGLKAVERSIFVKVGRSLGLTPFKMLHLIILPSAAPYLFSGWRLGFAYSIIGVMASEFIVSTSGLGYVIKRMFDNFETANMYALILMVLLIVIAVIGLLQFIEYRLNAFAQSAQANAPQLTVERFSLWWLLPPTLVIVGWHFLSIARSPFIPSPLDTFLHLGREITSGGLLRHIYDTVTTFGKAALWAIFMGLVVGSFLGFYRIFYQAYAGSVQAIYSIPKVILYPLFLLFFGIGQASKAAFGAFHGLFPIAIYTWTAIRTLKPVYLKAARSLGVKGIRALTDVALPALVSPIFAGIRLGLNLSFLGVILGEMLVSRSGLGFLLTAYTGAFDVLRIFSVIVVIFFLALAIGAVVWVLERLVRDRAI